MTDNADKKNRVFFLHFRLVYDGALRSSPRAAAQATGGFTVAYSYNDKCVDYAIATVNPADRYVKAIGRKVSSERLGTVEAGHWPGNVDEFRAIMPRVLQRRLDKRN